MTRKSKKPKIIPGQWGGWRPGSGAPAIKEGVETVTYSIRMTPDQKSKLMRLGGGEWVREMVEAAKL